MLSTAPAIDGRIGDAWSQAASVSLGSDFTNRRNADEATAVRVAQTAGALVFAFDVTQSEPIVASTTTNGSSVTGDDYVGVALIAERSARLPIRLLCESRRGALPDLEREQRVHAVMGCGRPCGARAATRRRCASRSSSSAAAAVRRGARNCSARPSIANALDVWAYDAHQSNFGDATYFGTLDGIGNEARRDDDASAARARKSTVSAN